MADYNGLTMSQPGAGDIPDIAIASMQGPELGQEDYVFDPNMFNDMNVDLSALPDFTPTYDFSAGFDDPLSYTNPQNNAGYFESFLDPGHRVTSPPTQPDLDNKLLGFGAPVHKTPVLDNSGQRWPRLVAELNGMFSIAEDVFEGETTGRPLELTCYRRNLFQISGSITMSRSLAQVALEGRNANITELYASLSATESIEGKPTDVISVPWKTGVAGLTGSSLEDKSGSAPANIPIDLSSNQEDPVLITIPIAWRRLQFKYATANNGRRKGLQQHYQVQIALMAKVESESEDVRVAEIHSNPIVVRGRSPKNFDSSKDVPLSERKQSDPARRIGSQIGGGANVATATPQWIEPAVMMGSGKYYAQQSFAPQSAENISTWPHMSPSVPTLTHHSPPSGGEPNPKRHASVSFSPIASRRRPQSQITPAIPRHYTAPEVKAEPQTSYSHVQQSQLATGKRSPMHLSLSDDDPPTHISIPSSSVSPPVEQHPEPLQSPTMGTQQRQHRPSVTSPAETGAIDQLYEYFPLGLDDWMPPVDAIYRPHVVHHLKVVSDVKDEVKGFAAGCASSGRGLKPKRYFSGGSE